MSHSICIYCGSRTPKNGGFRQLAIETGTAVAEQNWNLVYGGGKIGMMGLAADAALQAGGKVIGIIPTALKRLEVVHTGLTELHETPDMHSRKSLMEQLSDAFLILPGGYGTMDEFFEILTWKQLGFHQKPIVLLNPGGYFDGLIAYVKNAVSEEVIRREHLDFFSVAHSAHEAVNILNRYLGWGIRG